MLIIFTQLHFRTRDLRTANLTTRRGSNRKQRISEYGNSGRHIVSAAEWKSYHIRQPFPKLTQERYIGSFDYISYPFADLLDSVAVILILWLVTATVTDAITLFYGHDTRTLVIADVFERLLQISVTPFCSIRKLSYTRRNRSFS